MSQKLLEYRTALANRLQDIAIKAGEITLEHFDESGFDGVMTKGDGSPVTIADQQAEALIEQELEKLVPGIPFVGEEKIAAGHQVDVSTAPYFWLVDALDGTREFVAGRTEYTVNIALIHNGIPVVGVVHAPACDQIYLGHHEKDGQARARYINLETGKEREIFTRAEPDEGLTVMSSRHFGSHDRLDRFLDHYKIAKKITRGSSLKICGIAAGKADLYPRFGPTCQWDTAAGHAVLRAAGGTLRTVDGQELIYGGTDPEFYNPEFIATRQGFLLPHEIEDLAV